MLVALGKYVSTLTAGLMCAPLILAVMYTTTERVQPFPMALLSDEFVTPTIRDGVLMVKFEFGLYIFIYAIQGNWNQEAERAFHILETQVRKVPTG